MEKLFADFVDKPTSRETHDEPEQETLRVTHDLHAEDQAAINERVKVCEKRLGEAVDKHTLWEVAHAEQAKLHRAHREQHAALQDRVEYLDERLGTCREYVVKLLEDSAEKSGFSAHLEHFQME